MEPNNQNTNPTQKPNRQELTPGFFKRYERHRITSLNPRPTPVPIIKMHGNVVSTRQGLTLLSGPSKSGKTAITSALLAGAITTNGNYDGCADIEIIENTAGHAVVHIDTEQSEHQHYHNFKNGILRRARLENEPAYFHSYNTRNFSLEEYQPFLVELLLNLKQEHGGVHLVVVDGIADFINSVNDEEEANEIVQCFSKVAAIANTAIVVVLHLNPGTTKERGHLGSQLQRKCESVLSIVKDGDVSLLEARYLRNGSVSDFTPIAFQYNEEEGYHIFLQGFQAAKLLNLHALAAAVFTQPRKYGEAVLLIEETERCSTRTAKTRMKQLETALLIKPARLDGQPIYVPVVAEPVMAESEVPF